jgi:tetrahydromethanopterin S-methyltransferase subunit B
VSEWSGAFLGIIAVATLVMALIQVGAIIAVVRIARQAQDVLTSVQREVKPLIARAGEIAEEASRTATLATDQVQKIDTLVTDLARRVDETSVLVQQAIVTPAREGIAIVAAIKAALSAFKGFGDFRGRPGRPGEEDDALFIG